MCDDRPPHPIDIIVDPERLAQLDVTLLDDHRTNRTLAQA
jgi:hypothetical protein